MILLSFGCAETGRGKTAALGKIRVDERGKTAALKMKTPRSYSEVPRWKLNLQQSVFKLLQGNQTNEGLGMTTEPFTSERLTLPIHSKRI